jgi:hypothetical protein
MGVSGSTTIYGTFNTNLGALKYLRHVLTPSIGYTYTPDFSDPYWGYYQPVTIDTIGTKKRFDRFAGTGIGGSPQGGTQSINFGVGQVFQAKVGSGEEDLKKIDLFNTTSAVAYNFKAPQFKLSNLNSSLRANPFQNISVSANAEHDFYVTDYTTGTRINKLLLDQKGFFHMVRLVRYDLSLSGSFKYRGGFSFDTKDTTSADSLEPSAIGNNLDQKPAPINPARKITQNPQTFLSTPLDISLSASFRREMQDPRFKTKTFFGTLNIGSQVTKFWSFRYNSSWDLNDILRPRLVYHSIMINRDLHCWTFSFDWRPSGTFSGYTLLIQLRAPELRDIKYMKRDYTGDVKGY